MSDTTMIVSFDNEDFKAIKQVNEILETLITELKKEKKDKILFGYDTPTPNKNIKLDTLIENAKVFDKLNPNK